MSPRFNFIGNVNVGKDLRLLDLQNHYDAILFSYGASKDRKLGIPGEGLKGVYSARDFVGWYNGSPENSNLNPNLDTGDEAVIIGQGNVALDVARTLLTEVDVLKKTDMTDYALASLAKSKIKRVHIVGRRGPMQVRKLTSLNFHAWTNQSPIKGCFHYQRSARTAKIAFCVLRFDSTSTTSRRFKTLASTEAADSTFGKRLANIPSRCSKIMGAGIPPFPHGIQRK